MANRPLFESEPYHRLLQLVGVLHIMEVRSTERRLKFLNMTFPQLAALMALHHKNGVNQTDLSAALKADTTSVMVICDSLEKKGWLKRSPDMSDRRVNRLFLTKAGRNAYSEARTILRKEEDYMATNVPDVELRQIINGLEHLVTEFEGFLRDNH